MLKLYTVRGHYIAVQGLILHTSLQRMYHITGLVQERCNSIANALELHLSGTNPVISIVSILWDHAITPLCCIQLGKTKLNTVEYNNNYWNNPDSKVHGANMGPTWVLSAPDGPHVGPMNLAIRECFTISLCYYKKQKKYPYYVFLPGLICWRLLVITQETPVDTSQSLISGHFIT